MEKWWLFHEVEVNGLELHWAIGTHKNVMVVETISNFWFFSSLILTWEQSFSAIWLSLPENLDFCDSDWGVYDEIFQTS